MKTRKNGARKKTLIAKRNFQKGIATAKKLVFDPKVDLDSFKIEPPNHFNSTLEHMDFVTSKLWTHSIFLTKK